jgi:hypothetical protein
MDSSDVKDNKKYRHSGDSVEDEVQKLFRKNNGKISSSDFMKLRQKYDDADLVEKIQKAYLDKHSTISKKAKKFAQLIREKYSNQQYPFHVLLEKARLFKVKHGLSDDEFAEFQRIYEQELVGLKSPEVVIPSTNMMKVLGSINVDFQGFALKLNDNDYKFLQEILKLYSASRPLHAQVLLQSMQYRDCDFEALTGEYKRELGHRPTESIHPVIAAMFLPKIEELETHFLHSNIAGIVKARYNGESLTNRPDYELFYALTNDPNDVVCDNRSSIQDLLNRAQVQNQLWNCVLNLRNGQYYNAVFRDFVGSVDMCRLNKQDNPDLVYGRYDGTILKRLLSAFSFRPTIVSTTPVYNIVNLNPYQQNVRPVVTAVPMINLRLPPTINDSTPISLGDALDQHQYFLENGAMIPRHTSLIYSRGVLFFFVDRRANVIRYNDMQPFNIARLPLSVSGFERLNDREVDYKDEITIRSDVYQLRSVVLAEVNRNAPERNLVVGSSTLIMNHADPANGIFTPEYLHYDPISVSDAVEVGGQLVARKPVTEINGTPGVGFTSFYEMARQRGIIFMYKLHKDDTKGEVVY